MSVTVKLKGHCYYYYYSSSLQIFIIQVQNLSSEKHGSTKVNQDSVFNSGAVFSGEHLEKSDEKVKFFIYLYVLYKK